MIKPLNLFAIKIYQKNDQSESGQQHPQASLFFLVIGALSHKQVLTILIIKHIIISILRMQGNIIGSVVVSQALKTLANEKKKKEEEVYTDEKSSTGQQPPKEKRIIIAKKQINFFRRITKIYPTIPSDHIYRLFGVFGLNQKAMEDPDCKESALLTHFINRVVEKVQFFDHAIVIELSEPFFNQPSVEYIIEKYKSKGNKDYYELASTIQELIQSYAELLSKGYPPQKPDTVKKWLDYMGDNMFVIFLGPRKQAISKKLLTHLGYDLEELAVQMAKYRACFLEIFAMRNYMTCLKYFVRAQIYAVKLALGELTFKQFKEITTFKITDFLIGKNRERWYCDISFYFLNADYFVTSVDFIYYKDNDNGYKRLDNDRWTRQIQLQKGRINSEEFKTMKKTKDMGQSRKQEEEEKQYLTAGYKECREETSSLDNQL